MAVPKRTAETRTRTQDREEVAEMYFWNALNKKTPRDRLFLSSGVKLTWWNLQYYEKWQIFHSVPRSTRQGNNTCNEGDLRHRFDRCLRFYRALSPNGPVLRLTRASLILRRGAKCKVKVLSFSFGKYNINTIKQTFNCSKDCIGRSAFDIFLSGLEIGPCKLAHMC